MFSSSVCFPRDVPRPYVCARRRSKDKFLKQLFWYDVWDGPVAGATVVVERILEHQNAYVKMNFRK